MIDNKGITFKQKATYVFNTICKFMLNAFLILTFVFVIVLVVFNLYARVASKTGKKVSQPLFNAYVIISPSMVPTINVLDAVISFKANPNNLKKGDIITFSSGDARYNGLTVTHRVYNTENVNGEKQFSTKGDNNTTPDGTQVKASNILGKTIFVIPWLGFLQFFLTKFYGWVILVVIPCVLMILFDVLKLKETIETNKKIEEAERKAEYDLEASINSIKIIEVDDNNGGLNTL